MPSLWLWFWLIVVVIVGPSAPLIIKIYNQTIESKSQWFLLLLVMVLYLILIYGFMVILKDEKVSTIYTLVIGLAIIYTVLFGTLVFKETLEYSDMFGIGLILVGSFILGRKI